MSLSTSLSMYTGADISARSHIKKDGLAPVLYVLEGWVHLLAQSKLTSVENTAAKPSREVSVDARPGVYIDAS